MAQSSASSNEMVDKEMDFYEQLKEYYGEGYVKKLCAKKFRGKVINWYLIHKYANEVGYTPSSPAESSTQNKFLQVIEKYLTHFDKDKDYKEKAKKYFGEIRDRFDDSVLRKFDYDHDEQSDDYQGVNEIEESHDNKMGHDDSFASKIQYHLKMIMKERKIGKSTKDGIFNGVSRIKDIIANEVEKVNSLPDNHNVLFFGRNGSGKSTLINLLLFATTNQIPNESYKQESASKRFHNLEAIKFLKSFDKENEIDETIFDLTEKWELIYNKNKENINAAAEVGSPIDKNCQYELVDFNHLINSDGKWTIEADYTKELETLKQHHTRNGDNAPLPVDPYILLAAEKKKRAKKSSTAHITYVRYGCRWQAVLTLFSLDDILRRFDNEANKAEMKTEAWDLINALSNQNSTAESSSSKRINLDPPSSKDEAMDFIPPDFKEFMERTRGFVVIPPGDDIVIDRMIVRKEMINLVDKYGSFIKDITVFAPSTLLRDNNITLIDAPGDDDRDWAKTNQLAHACDIADSVVVLSKKEVDAGLNLDSFMALFYQRMIDSDNRIPIYVLLREDPEGFASVEDLDDLEKNRKGKEKLKTLLSLRSAVDKCSRMDGRTDDERKALMSIKDFVDIQGGYFFHIWLAMTGLGPSATTSELRSMLLEESGYNDFMRFLSTRVAPKSSAVISAPKYTVDILEASKDMKLLIEKDPNVEAWKFIQNKVKDSNDKKLYYSMKKTLSQHPFFWKSTLHQPQNKSQGKTCSFYGEIEKICNKSATRIFKEIRSRFEGSSKADIMRKIKENWTEENIKTMLALDQPNVPHPQEYRLFAEEIIPLFAPQDYRDIIPLFDQEILPQFKKCAEDACKLHAFQDNIENDTTSGRRSSASNATPKSDEDLIKELAKNDPLLKNAYEYVTKRLETGVFEILVRGSVRDYLKKEHQDFLERNGLLVDVRLAIKKRLLDKLKIKTKSKIDPKEIVKCIVDVLDEANLKKIILEAVEGSIHNVLRSLMHAFVERKRLPILKRVFDTLFTSPPPSLLPETKAVIVEQLDAIISICNEEKLN